MTLKDLLTKKDRIEEDDASSLSPPEPPEFTFLRTTTNTQEVIAPPSYPGDDKPLPPSPPRRKHSIFRRRHSHTSAPSDRARGEHRLSEKLHISRSRSATASSTNVPANLPVIRGDAAGNEEQEAQWENRATLLARGNSVLRPKSSGANKAEQHGDDGHNSKSVSVGDQKSDDDIQEAIRLHEAGDLQKSTEMFGRLGAPDGPNNALSQVLYGLALRYGNQFGHGSVGPARCPLSDDLTSIPGTGGDVKKTNRSQSHICLMQRLTAQRLSPSRFSPG